MKLYIKIIIAVFVLIIIIGYLLDNLYTTYFNGIWNCDSEFLTKSDLQTCVFYFNNNKGYLTMIKSDGEVIYNDIVKYSLSYNVLSYNILFCEYKKDGIIYFESDLPFPKELKYCISIIDNSLILKDDEKIYLHLRRDALASNI